MTDSAEVIVLGAGPAGLGAACWLARAGHQVTVLERGPAVGGMAASHVVAGQRVDAGSHRLHPATPPAVLGLLRELLGDELQERPRRGRVRLADRWLGFPLRPADLARTLPPRLLAGAAGSAGVAMFRRRKDATFADVVTTTLGRAMGESFYFPFAEKIWGLKADELSGTAARRRISVDSPVSLLRRVLAGSRDSAEPRHFYYPAGGFGRIPEVLAEAAVAAGAQIRCGAEVIGIRTDDRAAAVRLRDGSTLTAAQIFSTIPVTLLAGLLDPPPTPVRLNSRALLLVYLVVARPRYTEFDAHYFPAADLPISRLSEPKNYRDGPDPADRSVLCAELPCWPEDEIWAAPDADIGALVTDALRRCGLPDPHAQEVVVRRLRHAYPVYRVGYEHALGALLDDLDRRPRLLTFGRQGLFAHDNTHHALAMAAAATDALRPDGTLDRAAWSRARAGFAAHVVQD